MNRKINQLEITNELTTFLANGGVIKKCKPKLAPKRRLTKPRNTLISTQPTISIFKLLIGGARD